MSKKLSSDQIKAIIDTMVIVVDSREKVNSHIIDAFDKYGITWVQEKLESGDYTAYVPQNPPLGVDEWIDLRDELCIERKASCDEIIQNLTRNKERFCREFERSTADIPILIEDSFENAVKGNYRSQITPKAFLGALFSFCDKNSTFFYFMEDKKHSALWIYDMLKYRVRNKLKDL